MSIAVFLAAAVLAFFPASANGGGIPLSPTEHAFLVEINKTRVEHGVGRVVLSDNLVRAARFHSQDMIRRGYFEHGVYWRRLQQFGVKYGSVGENLGWDSHLKIAVPELVELWLESPEHRAVLLSRKYNEVGIGVAFGPFAGIRKVMVVTADFFGP